MGIRPAFGGPARQAVNASAGYARDAVSSLAALALNAVTGLAALVVLALVMVSAALVPVAGLGRAPLGLGLVLVHRLAAHQRRWAGRVLDRDGAAGGHRREMGRPWRATAVPEARRRGTRRELGWLAVHVVTGPAPVAAVLAMLAALDYVWFRLQPTQTGTLNTFALSLSIVAIAAVALMAIFQFRIGQARLARRLLDGDTATDARIRALTASRAAVVDARAAELRRIERDLHDGAQAKLIAISMHLGLARGSRDPGEMARMIDEAREVAGQALTDLRDLVRGIHPPVLSDRGLAGAIEASALLCPIPVEVDIDLPGRPQPPVESAVYFAVAEALVNVAKHSGASRAWVRLRHTTGVLRMTVGDNGCGMVRCDGGTGVRGIEDRLSAFDGSLTVSSPQGGPTILTMEVPCALS
ncbi:histidine kinase [Nonomuraea sp. NPDC049421]|uniref:sensor histidine kinase n=1 Tax=Nonomuraea sp. NPDC049421 TaxID=3155275 RepID=UPI0034374653